MKKVALIFISLVFVAGCSSIGKTPESEYSVNTAEIASKLKVLKKNNFVWKTNKMAKGVNFVSEHVKKAEENKLKGDYLSANKELSIANAFADAALEQMHAQINAVPEWEQ